MIILKNDIIYIVDYDSVKYVTAGTGICMFKKEMGRTRETILCDEKSLLMDILKKLLEDDCCENIEIYSQKIKRDHKLTIDELLGSK